MILHCPVPFPWIHCSWFRRVITFILCILKLRWSTCLWPGYLWILISQLFWQCWISWPFCKQLCHMKLSFEFGTWWLCMTITLRLPISCICRVLGRGLRITMNTTPVWLFVSIWSTRNFCLNISCTLQLPIFLLALDIWSLSIEQVTSSTEQMTSFAQTRK